MQTFQGPQFEPGDLVNWLIPPASLGPSTPGLIQSLAIDEDGVWWGIYIVLIDGRPRWINESQLKRIKYVD